MAGFAKAILITILASAAIILLFNLAFFFPWYIEVIETTFQVSQMIATDNYLTYDNYETVYNNLKEKPIFKERTGSKQLKIEAFHESGKDAIERESARDVNTYYYPLSKEEDKPYVQMGNLVTIEIHATYPFRMTIFGRSINSGKMDIPVTFRMTTSTTRHYKDLPYNYGVDGGYFDDYDD